jgi:hypothetical protein
LIIFDLFVFYFEDTITSEYDKTKIKLTLAYLNFVRVGRYKNLFNITYIHHTACFLLQNR